LSVTNFILNEAACVFVNGVLNREVKQHLLIDSDRPLNEALNKALKLGAAKVVPGQPAKLRDVRVRALMGTWPPGTEYHRTG
jgi:hypothetical protein